MHEWDHAAWPQMFEKLTSSNQIGMSYPKERVKCRIMQPDVKLEAFMENAAFWCVQKEKCILSKWEEKEAIMYLYFLK